MLWPVAGQDKLQTERESTEALPAAGSMLQIPVISGQNAKRMKPTENISDVKTSIITLKLVNDWTFYQRIPFHSLLGNLHRCPKVAERNAD